MVNVSKYFVQMYSFIFNMWGETDIILDFLLSIKFIGLPWWLSGKESAANASDVDLIHGLEISTDGGHANPLHYSYLENPRYSGAW